MKKHIRIISIVIVLIIMAQIALPCTAEDTGGASPETLRVAYYPLDGFFEYDDNGNETGYGVKLLEKISQYSGIRFDYVPCDSWENTKQMLLDGKADLRMPATMPTTPSATLSYNNSSIIETYHVIMTTKERNDLYYQDDDTIKKLKIAIVTSLYQQESVHTSLAAIGISENQLVFCDEYAQCNEKLKNGKVDALVSNIMDMDDSMKLLARFDSISNYFSMTINNPVLTLLDQTIAQIKLDEPLFLSDLYEEWFPERTNIPFTREESRYISSLDSLTFAFRKDEGYLSRYEKGTYSGIYVEQARLICEKLGVDFKAVSREDCLAGEITTDVFTGFFYDKNYADEFGYCISSPVNDIKYYLVQRKETTLDENTCKVAAIKRFRYTQEYLEKKYDKSQLVYFESYEECLRAIENGKVDIAVINNYIAEYYLELYQYNNLSAKLITDYSHLYCFATANENDVLASILSKTLTSLSDDEMKQMYIRGVENKPESDSILSFIYGNPLMFTCIVAVLLAMIIALLLMLAFVKRSRAQNKSLEKALSAKSDFLARMSHDMRTPLNAVLGFTKLAQDEIRNWDSVQDSLLKIESSGEYLLGLINDVLDASKIDSGKIELHTEAVDSKAFFDEIAGEFKAQAQLKNITLQSEINIENIPPLKIDKLRTRQIYFNLLNNAIKFSEAGSEIDLKITEKQKDDKSYEFNSSISDNGCGMSEEFLEHMFEPFSQEIFPGEQKEGTGLGLTIVKKLVDLSGGTISVVSKRGEGTTFSLCISYEVCDKCDKPEINKAVNSVDYSGLSGKRVLICEDHHLNMEITVRLLKKVGIKADCAENGKIGTDFFRQSDIGYYDAVLMDMRMPVMDGIKATQEIRAMPREDAKKIPIIAVTANAYDDDVKNTLNAGMNSHLAKPINPRELYETLNILIGDNRQYVQEKKHE